jgi:hypothetical protein
MPPARWASAAARHAAGIAGLIDTFAGVPTLTWAATTAPARSPPARLTLPTDLAIANGSGAVAFTGSVDSAAGPARDLT